VGLCGRGKGGFFCGELGDLLAQNFARAVVFGLLGGNALGDPALERRVMPPRQSA
jgi:hypothetical protein